MTTHCPHCGCDTGKPPPRKLRSVPQHRRAFAMIRAAYDHWPETHQFRPESEEHLRAWLICKASYHTVQTIDLDATEPAAAVVMIAAAYAQAGRWHFTKTSGTRLHVFAPKSMAFDQMPHHQACTLFDDIAEMIEAETDLRIDDIMPPVRDRRRTA